MLSLRAACLLVAVAAPRAAIAIDPGDTFEVKTVYVNDMR